MDESADVHHGLGLGARLMHDGARKYEVCISHEVEELATGNGQKILVFFFLKKLYFWSPFCNKEPQTLAQFKITYTPLVPLCT